MTKRGNRQSATWRPACSNFRTKPPVRASSWLSRYRNLRKTVWTQPFVEGIFRFRMLTKNTATQVLGSTEGLLINPITGLGKGEAIYRNPVAGTETVTSVCTFPMRLRTPCPLAMLTRPQRTTLRMSPTLHDAGLSLANPLFGPCGASFVLPHLL